MSQLCPICQKPVDPIRAPAVKVRAGKVVAFCSAECAKAGETQPTAMPRPAAAPRRTPAPGVAVAVAKADSDPVIEILHEPVSGVVTSAKDTRVPRAPLLPDNFSPRGMARKPEPDTLDNWTLPVEDGQEAEERAQQSRRARRAETPLPIAPSRRRAPILVAILLVVGGLAFLAYRYVNGMGGVTSGDPPATAAKVESGSAESAPRPAPPTGPTAVNALARAREVLNQHMHSDSPRVQRVAAAALARTGDKDAIIALVDVLAREASDVAKLDIGYALARGGDPRGGDALATAANSGRSRDVRAEASRLLALLGDPRAIPALSRYLDVSQLRLGAAEQLAFVSDPRALKVLDQIRGESKSSADDKARATIALGTAGRIDVAPALRQLLTDGRFNAFAATALATLHDPAAEPVLKSHLVIPSLRVGAARGLRRLDPNLDVQSLLPPLLAALTGGKDTEQIQICEAVLLLAGPPEWSLRP